MTLREMEIFLAVTEHKTMRKASEMLYISQPTISGVIGKIEQDLGTQVFERLGKKLYLTSTGETLLAYSKKILQLHREMMEEVSAHQQMRLKIGATISVGGKLLNSILKQWEEPQPFVKITNTHEIEQKLLDAELDCAIVEGQVHAKDLISVPMFRDQMYLICGREHPLFEVDQVSIQALANQTLILRENGSGTKETTLQLLAQHNISYEVLWESNSIEAIFEAVKNNIGVTIASDKLLDHQPDLKKVEIVDCDFTRVFQFVYHKDKYMSKMLCEFIALCERLAG